MRIRGAQLISALKLPRPFKSLAHLAEIKETCAAPLMNRMLISRYFTPLEEIQILRIRARYDVRVSNIVTAYRPRGDRYYSGSEHSTVLPTGWVGL
jgi:hypothetical protein